MKMHYLSKKEETAIKSNIPWEDLDPGAIELVRIANTVKGIATVQSCAGHIKPKKDLMGGFHVRNSCLSFRCTEDRAHEILFDKACEYLIDTELRYFSDGTFFISLLVEPGNRTKLFKLLKALKG